MMRTNHGLLEMRRQTPELYQKYFGITIQMIGIIILYRVKSI